MGPEQAQEKMRVERWNSPGTGDPLGAGEGFKGKNSDCNFRETSEWWRRVRGGISRQKQDEWKWGAEFVQELPCQLLRGVMGLAAIGPSGMKDCWSQGPIREGWKDGKAREGCTM